MSINPARILVVDDNPATRYSTSRILRSAGWSVVEAENGEEACYKAPTGIDLVVLDVNLPDIDGFTVCRRLRANELTARVPIIHLSATFVTTEYKVTGLDAGADGYLVHPVEPAVLIATVNAFLRTRQAEIELRESEARFTAVFDHALNGVTTFDEAMVFVDVNPAMCELLRARREEITGRPLREFVPADQAEALEIVAQQLQARNAWQGCLPLRNKLGDLIYLDWNISLHTSSRLRLAIVTDISERLLHEQERDRLLDSERHARAEAERANQLKDDFLATLSHELRTPLNAIVGWSQLLLTGKLNANDTRDGLEAIQRNATAQAQMISDLLDISRITAGKMRLEMTLVDLAVVVDAAISSIAPSAEAKKIRIIKDIRAGSGLVSGDASRLQQVLWNLINNAVKFTPPEGSVRLTLQRSGEHQEIRVADSGLGISAEEIPVIFERFRQVDSSTTREHTGLGLGLAIARQLVEIHGGTIDVESPGHDQGSTFTVTLPAASESPDEAAISRPSLQAGTASTTELPGVRVMIVEDNSDSRAVLKRILQSFGAEVCDVDSANQALNSIAHFRPQVLISDLGMPGYDGLALIREVRARGYSANDLPAVALTAFARLTDRRQALQAGFQAHLAKPVEPADLLTAIHSVIDRVGR